MYSGVEQFKDERTQDEIFTELLPESLYLSHYDLNERYPHYSRNEWRRYLQDNDRFILKETALIAEANARQALKKLANGDMKTQEVSAISQLLNRSEQINQQAKDQTVYIATFMPDPNKLEKEPEKDPYDRYKENQEVLRLFFTDEEIRSRNIKKQLEINADGTAYILESPDKYAQLDMLYKHFVNDKRITDNREVSKEWQ